MLQPSADPRVRLVASGDADDLRATLELVAELVSDDPDVVVVDRPSGPPDHTPSIALVDDVDDIPRWLERGFQGGLDRRSDADVLAAALGAVAAGLAVHPTTTPRADVPELTPREREVLELLAQGFSNREIGEVLDISSHTAKFHVQGVLDKLDATTRTEAAVRAARMFII